MFWAAEAAQFVTPDKDKTPKRICLGLEAFGNNRRIPLETVQFKAHTLKHSPKTGRWEWA